MNNLVMGNDSCFESIPSNSLLPQMRLALAINQRKIFLNSEVTEDSIFECVYYLNKITDIDLRLNVKNPIDIMINSNGGSVYDGFILISMIEQLKDSGYNIRTTNIGKSFSMGALISMVGSERVAYRHSRYMIHDISAFTMGKLESMKRDIEEYNQLREQSYNIITKYSKITREMLEDWHEKKIDKFFSAREALEFGLADKIL